jgi:hypothetical protein
VELVVLLIDEELVVELVVEVVEGDGAGEEPPPPHPSRKNTAGTIIKNIIAAIRGVHALKVGNCFFKGSSFIYPDFIYSVR